MVQNASEWRVHSGGPATAQRPQLAKTVLYYAPSRNHFSDLRLRLGTVPGCWAGGSCVEFNPVHVCFVLENEPRAAMETLHRRYFNLVVIDLRDLPNQDAGFDQHVAGAFELLDLMDHEGDVEARFGFHRVVALVSGESEATDRLIAALGSRRVGRVLRDRRDGDGGRKGTRPFPQAVLDEMRGLMLGRKVGARAMCCAGGGVTGIYFETGVLKCISDCLEPGAVNNFDLYFGISAGAVVASLLANGYSVDDWMAAISGCEGGRIPPVNLNVFRFGFLDRADIAERAARAVRSVVKTLWNTSVHRKRPSFDRLLLEYSELLGPPLQSNHFERTLAELFSVPGTSNDFRNVRKRLYVGATDQDLRAHILFGEPGYDAVPISRAIQASSAVHPAFTSALIEGRYYTDGAVTSTSHVPEAIEKGADLLINVDPFVPYVSKKPGYVRRRGLLYNIDQDLRTLSYTRFERTRVAALRRHPEVSSYTFLPANSLRKVLSINPMDHRHYFPIWRGAYLSTLRRILRLRYRMRGDLAQHGLSLDTSRAEAVADRLRNIEQPTLGDFFPDGRWEPTPSPAPLPANTQPAPPPSVLEAFAMPLLPGS